MVNSQQVQYANYHHYVKTDKQNFQVLFDSLYSFAVFFLMTGFGLGLLFLSAIICVLMGFIACGIFAVWIM